MASFNAHRGEQQQPGRRGHSGPTDEEQSSLPGVSPAELQRVDLNHAVERELAQIDDLDETIAHALVSYRVHHGHFESWADVAKVPGIEPLHISSLQRVARLGGHA